MKYRVPAILSIPKPCRQSWHAMEPVAGGRYCNACEKRVTDFTGLSDEAILRLLAGSSEKVCGRLRESQLNRPLEQPREHSSLFAGALATILGISTSLPGIAQSTAVDPSVQNVLTDTTGSKSYPWPQEITIRGLLHDSATFEPISGALVMVAHRNIYLTSDEYGRFELTLQPGDTDSLILEVQSIGHKRVRLQVTPENYNHLYLLLQEQPYECAEPVVVASEREKVYVGELPVHPIKREKAVTRWYHRFLRLFRSRD